MQELEALGNEVQNLSAQLVDLERKIMSINDEIKLIELKKKILLKIFSLLNEHLTLKIDHVQRQLVECLSVKASYEKFSYIDLEVVEIASYGLCTILSISNVVKDTWEKEFENLKESFADCCSRHST